MSGDYISRAAAIAALGEIHPLDYNVQSEKRRIEAIPAADVVEVVRCRECANWQSGWKPSNAKDGTHFCANVGLCTPSDWYCADGERKDGGQDDAPAGPYDLLYEEGGPDA